MKGELKAGGLALIIASNDPQDIGKCVTLVQFVQPGQHFTAPDGVPCWWRADYPPAWVVSGDLSTDSAAEYDDRKFHGWAVYQPCCLMPIDGDYDQAPEQLTKDRPAELTA